MYTSRSARSIFFVFLFLALFSAIVPSATHGASAATGGEEAKLSLYAKQIASVRATVERMFQTVRELSLSRNKNTAQVAALAPLIWSARITATNNDAEESATGAISLFDKDLDLGGDDGTALVGLRFQDVMIPQGATITKAYLEFTAEETKTALTSLIVRAEISDNSVAFVTTEKTLLLRDKFATEASWKKLLLWTSGNVEQSPDISQVIQKVVDRPLWKSGNALSLFITGEGDRDAHSYDSDPLRAPLLYIEYTSAATTTSAPVPIPVPTPTPVIPPAQTPVPTPIPVPQPPIVSSPLLPAPEPLPPAPIPSLSCPAINETVEVGDCVRTLGALNVRSGAGGKIIGKQKNDRGGTIIGGPIGTKGMRWWNIDYHQGVDGWSADSLFEELSSPLLSSDMRIKTFERVNVRSAPNGKKLGTQKPNAEGILESFGYADKLWWWNVNYDTGVDGWSAENFLTPLEKR